jgi:hypothetical protein
MIVDGEFRHQSRVTKSEDGFLIDLFIFWIQKDKEEYHSKSKFINFPPFA